MVHLHKGILYSKKKEKTTDTHHFMDKSEMYFQNTTYHVILLILHSRTDEIIGVENRSMVTGV